MRTAVLLLVLVVASPAVSAKKIKPFNAEGAHRMLEVIYVASRENIVEDEDFYRELLDLGIKDEDISDGSAASGMIYCCGGKISMESRFVFYVPPEIRVQVGDLVEIRLGKDYGVATAVQVRQAAGSSARTCRWDPEQEGLWMRVVFCDWMPKEGWVYNNKARNTWYKLAPPGVR